MQGLANLQAELTAEPEGQWLVGRFDTFGSAPKRSARR